MSRRNCAHCSRSGLQPSARSGNSAAPRAPRPLMVHPSRRFDRDGRAGRVGELHSYTFVASTAPLSTATSRRRLRHDAPMWTAPPPVVPGTLVAPLVGSLLRTAARRRRCYAESWAFRGGMAGASVHSSYGRRPPPGRHRLRRHPSHRTRRLRRTAAADASRRRRSGDPVVYRHHHHLAAGSYHHHHGSNHPDCQSHRHPAPNFQAHARRRRRRLRPGGAALLHRLLPSMEILLQRPSGQRRYPSCLRSWARAWSWSPSWSWWHRCSTASSRRSFPCSDQRWTTCPHRIREEQNRRE